MVICGGPIGMLDAEEVEGWGPGPETGPGAEDEAGANGAVDSGIGREFWDAGG